MYLQKVSFCLPKDGLLASERCPFAVRFVAFCKSAVCIVINLSCRHDFPLLVVWRVYGVLMQGAATEKAEGSGLILPFAFRLQHVLGLCNFYRFS